MADTTEHLLIEEVPRTGREVDAGRHIWARLAHDEQTFRSALTATALVVAALVVGAGLTGCGPAAATSRAASPVTSTSRPSATNPATTADLPPTPDPPTGLPGAGGLTSLVAGLGQKVGCWSPPVADTMQNAASADRFTAYCKIGNSPQDESSVQITIWATAGAQKKEVSAYARFGIPPDQASIVSGPLWDVGLASHEIALEALQRLGGTLR